MPTEYSAEWIRVPDGNGGYKKIWLRDSKARKAISDINADLSNYIPTSARGAANGVAPLNASRQIDATYLSTALSSYFLKSVGNTLYSNASNNNTIALSDNMAFGDITSSSKRVRIFIPYPVTGGTPTVTDLSVVLLLGTGGSPYARSGTDGGTYTQLGGNTPISIWANSASARSGEVASMTAYRKTRSGIYLLFTFAYGLAKASGNTAVITNNQAVTAHVTGTVTLS